MSNPIPDDIAAKAAELCWLKSPSPLRDQIVDHLVIAITKERERCYTVVQTRVKFYSKVQRDEAFAAILGGAPQ